MTHHKPHPEIVLRVLTAASCAASTALMVGDTEWDIEMAARAGIASCAATWGNHDAARLARAGPTHMVDSFAELRNLMGIVRDRGRTQLIAIQKLATCARLWHTDC